MNKNNLKLSVNTGFAVNRIIDNKKFIEFVKNKLRIRYIQPTSDWLSLFMDKKYSYKNISNLNKLMNKRDTELQSSAFLIIFFVCLMLPAIIAFMIGIFAPKSSGMVVDDLNTIMAYFFGAATGISVLISGRMLGRMMSWFWYVPSFALLSMLVYILGFNLIS